MTDRAEMEAAIEAVLFVSSEPVPRERLAEIFDEADRAEARQAIEAVIARYRGDGGGEGGAAGGGVAGAEAGGAAGGGEGASDGGGGDAGDGGGAIGRGVFVEEVAGGVRLVTRPEMNPWLRRFFEVTGAQKLSMAAIETLAIIAYRQPMTAPEVQELRGVSPSGVIKTLLERRMIRIAGRKEVVGRPFLYCTTREFLVHFGLKSLKDLPPLEELDDALDEAGGGEMGEPPPPEPGLEAGPGVDREERILQSVAAIEEAEEAGEGERAAESAGEEERAAEAEQPGPPARRPAAPRRPVAVEPADALQEAARDAGLGAAGDGESAGGGAGEAAPADAAPHDEAPTADQSVPAAGPENERP